MSARYVTATPLGSTPGHNAQLPVVRLLNIPRDSGETLHTRFIQNISGSPGVQTFVSSTAEGSGHGSVSMLSQVTPSAAPGTVRVSP